MSLHRLNTVLLGSLATIPMIASNAVVASSQNNKPNVIVIYTDDMGFGDISAFNSKCAFKTKHIDALAKGGMMCTDAYSASSISSPARAGLLTGRYPGRFGIREVFYPESFTGLPQSEIVLPEILKEAGYATGIIGKWHLGSRERFLPLQHGFDEYFGIPYSNDLSPVFLRGNEVETWRVDQSQITSTYTQEAKTFIKNHKNAPFFLYLAHNMPHTPLACSKKFEGKSGVGLYGDVMLELDWSVGEVMKCLEKEGILDNTIVIFSSDNGPWKSKGPFAGDSTPFYEGKFTQFEGGYRVPTIFYWHKHIKHSVSTDVISLLDVFPTVANLCGAKVPQDRVIDGFDLSKMILSQADCPRESFIYLKGNAVPHAIRVGEWKLMMKESKIAGDFWRTPTAAHDILLFNLKEDPIELYNYAKKHPKKVSELKAILDAFKIQSKLFPKPMQVVNPKLTNGFSQLQNEAMKREIKEKHLTPKGHAKDTPRTFINK